MSLPRFVRVVVERLAPPEFRDDLLADLEDVAARRRRSGQGVGWWLVGELARTPWFGLWSQARRLRAAGTRREMPAQGGGGMDGIGTGFRVAVRSLLRRPQYAGVAVATLALSIGAATVVFGVLEGVLLRPLPYEAGQRLHRVYGTNRAWREAEQEVLRANWDAVDVTQEYLANIRTRVGAVEASGGVHPFTARFEDGGEPVRLPGAYVLEGLFEALDLPPLLGRLPTAEEIRGRAPVVVLGEAAWTNRLGRDEGVLGRTVSLDGRAHTVVGVLPGAFAFPTELARWWAPPPPDFAAGRTDVALFRGVVRLAPDADPAAAAVALEGVLEAMAESDPTYAPMGVRLEPLADVVVGDVRDGIQLLFLAVGVVVLIAIVNLANLVVARGARRRGELAMRAALGASRRALVWDVMAETAVLAGVGCGVGILLATQLLDPFLALLERGNPGFPRAANVGLNPLVLGFSVGLAGLTAVLAGLAPALAASRRPPWEALQQGRRSRGGRTTRRTQSALLMAEALMAMVLLATSTLLLRSAAHVASIDPGYDGEAVAYLALETPEGRYPSAVDMDVLGRALQARLTGLPGTVSVARATSMPGLGGASGELVWGNDQSMDDAVLRWSTAVSPGYFRTMGIPLVAGRDFEESDGAEDALPVAVVSELFARSHFPERDPVGATFQTGVGARMEGGSIVTDSARTVTVVGVVADVRQLAVVLEPDPMMYQPISADRSDPYLVVRTREDPADILAAARAEVQAEDPTLLVESADVLHEAARRLLAPLEVRMILILVLAGLAALLTVAGVYGVVAYVVSDRTHEIGVRMALGARAGGESARMVRQALGPVVVGALLGLGGAFLASALLEDALFGVGRLDPLTYVAAFVAMLAVAAAAAWLPARRAASVDPMEVLAEE